MLDFFLRVLEISLFLVSQVKDNGSMHLISLSKL